MLFPLTQKEQVVGKILDIHIKNITANPNQPRKDFDELELARLAESIASNGIINPLSVRSVNGTYELVAGERRLRAAKMIGMQRVPCIILNIPERVSAVLSLLENIQRQELSFFDEAAGISRLIDVFGLTQEDVAAKLGRSQGAISNKLRLLRYSDDERRLIQKYNLTERHARAFLSITDEQTRMDAIRYVGMQGLNVAMTEKYLEKFAITQRENESFKKRACVLKNVRLFVNSINKTISTMKLAGINVNSSKIQSEEFIEYVIRIPTK